MESFTLSSRAAAQGVPRKYSDVLSCWTSGRELEGWISPRQKSWQYPLFLSSDIPTPRVWTQVATISKLPSIWIIQVAPPKDFPETLSLQTCGPIQAASSDLFHTNGLSWLLLQNLIKSLEGSQYPKKQYLDLACPVPLAEQSQALH